MKETVFVGKKSEMNPLNKGLVFDEGQSAVWRKQVRGEQIGSRLFLRGLPVANSYRVAQVLVIRLECATLPRMPMDWSYEDPGQERIERKTKATEEGKRWRLRPWHRTSRMSNLPRTWICLPPSRWQARTMRNEP